ncbi:MAG: aspartate--tRNA(Asn) ligase [Clostridiaceae bacterium]
MERTMMNQIIPGTGVKVQGFVERVRSTGAMAFLVLRDRMGKVQVTIEKAAHPEFAEDLNRLTPESVVTVEGRAVSNPQVRLNGLEILPERLTVESLAAPLPLNKDAAVDTRMDYRWLELRGEKERLLFEVQTCLVNAMREFLIERDFLEIHTPKLIAAASESGADVFEVKYFDRKAYLAQSPQFYKQMAMAAGFERIFETGPVFRAEKSFTNRHATEFSGFDLEFSYIESFEDVMRLEAELLAYSLEQVARTYGEAIERQYGVNVIVPQLPFPQIALKDLYTELERRYGYTLPESEKGDMTTEAEQLSYRFSKEEFGHEFLFITDFAAEKRAFYHMRKNGVPQGYDLIWRGVEITTGAQREHRYDVLCRQADERGLGEDVKFYTEFFRYGCPPHGGFGLGIDRMSMLLTGVTIKDAMFLFRGPNRLTP